MQVMLDKDLAELYGVNTMRLNEQVRRNMERFPESFCFQLTKEEMTMWISQFAISKSTKRGFRKQPLVFTEYGVAMVSAVLRSQIAIETSIHIVKAFIEYRKGKIQLEGNDYFRATIRLASQVIPLQKNCLRNLSLSFQHSKQLRNLLENSEGGVARA